MTGTLPAAGGLDTRAGGAAEPPRRRGGSTVGDGPLYPLIVLSGLAAAVQLDQTGFGVLIPRIRDAFGLSDAGILSVVAVTTVAALLLQLPIALAADRSNRSRLVVVGAVVFGVCSLLTGLVPALWALVAVRIGTASGQAVNDPVHSSLLSDWYAVDRRAGVFSTYRAGAAVGQFIGPLAAGALSQAFGWRVPFLVFVAPTVVLALAAVRLHDPLRGAREREAAGAGVEAIATEEPVPSVGEAWRLVWKVEVLRRIWYALPFLAVATIGYVSLAGLLYQRVFHYGDLRRGVVAALVEPCQLVGLAAGAGIAARRIERDPALVFTFLRAAAVLAGVAAVLFAFAPNIWLAVGANALVTATLAVLLPGILAVLSMAIPARARSVGFAVGAYWALPGLALVPLIGWVSDRVGIRWGMAAVAPVLVVGGLIVASAASVVGRDLRDVWVASTARADALLERRAGRATLLSIRSLEVSYRPVQVLFGVSLDAPDGEIVALLGTNGAGKSTLLRAVSGLTEADFGAVIFDGRDITHMPPSEIAALGVGHVSGGRGVFPGLTVGENLGVAGWLVRDTAAASTAAVLELFPVLAQRLSEPAGNLSGGQQQMLALAMALLRRPRLLLVDELSLGLAPTVVERLAEVIREAVAGGATVVLVEQSANVALHLAGTAAFLEKGRVRFTGPAGELADRPDLLRSVFLGASAPSTSPPAPGRGSRVVAEPVPGDPVPSQVRESASAALAVEHVTCVFGGVRAVDDVSLEIEAGEIVGLIGPNGAGKTTLLDAMSGFVRPVRGAVLMGGRDVTGVPPHRRARAGMARSFQDARLFGGLTVSEVLAVGCGRWVGSGDPVTAMLRLPASTTAEDWVRRRVDELTELFGLARLRDRFVSELSTGTRRVVDLATVVAHQPSVLLLDEPSAGIAQREAEQLVPLIRRIRDETGCAIVVVEHDIPVVRAVSDRLVALDSGRVLCTGDTDAVLGHPGVISAYLGGSPAMIERSAPIPSRSEE